MRPTPGLVLTCDSCGHREKTEIMISNSYFSAGDIAGWDCPKEGCMGQLAVWESTRFDGLGNAVPDVRQMMLKVLSPEQTVDEVVRLRDSIRRAQALIGSSRADRPSASDIIEEVEAGVPALLPLIRALAALTPDDPEGLIRAFSIILSMLSLYIGRPLDAVNENDLDTPRQVVELVVGPASSLLSDPSDDTDGGVFGVFDDEQAVPDSSSLRRPRDPDIVAAAHAHLLRTLSKSSDLANDLEGIQRALSEGSMGDTGALAESPALAGFAGLLRWLGMRRMANHQVVMRIKAVVRLYQADASRGRVHRSGASSEAVQRATDSILNTIRDIIVDDLDLYLRSST